MNRKGFRRGLALLAVLALAGCAGGGETGTGAGGQGPIPTPIPTPLPTPTPVPTPIVSIGAVTATAPGSASVNGVEYRVPSKVTVDGATLAAGALRVGMVATLKGTINADGLSGTADSVAVTKLVKGLASVVGASLTVLTQSIQVDETTSFAQGVAPDPAQLATALATLDKKYVEISGIVKKSGVVVATRVDVLVAPPSESRLIGIIGTFFIDEQTFTIGKLLVSFASLGKSSGSAFGSGSFVEVTGTLDDKGVLIASALEQAGFYEDNAERIELQDCVSYFGDLYDFAIGRFAVQATTSTVYTGGVATHMIEGTCVEVDGTLVDGVLNAAHISLQNKARVESNVATKNSDTFTLDGLSGLTVTVNSATEYVKGGNVTNFAAITIGHGVNVRGRYDPGTTTLLATRVDIGNQIGTDIVIRNYIDALTASPPTITLMGVVLDVAVDVMGSPVFTGGSAISQTEVKSLDDFYNVASPGNVVELEGKLNGTQITWNIVDLKD